MRGLQWVQRSHLSRGEPGSNLADSPAAEPHHCYFISRHCNPDLKHRQVRVWAQTWWTPQLLLKFQNLHEQSHREAFFTEMIGTEPHSVASHLEVILPQTMVEQGIMAFFTLATKEAECSKT